MNLGNLSYSRRERTVTSDPQSTACYAKDTVGTPYYRFCRSDPVSLTIPPGVIHCRDAGGHTPYRYGGAGRGYRRPP